jgi:HEPN domain-containing protein
MNKEEIIKYWVASAEDDFEAMNHLFDSKDYAWSLFIGHLVIEKLLKAYYCQSFGTTPLYIHNLLRLADECNLKITQERKNDLITLTSFNIQTRYPDFKREFSLKCTKEYTAQQISKIKELRKWLQEQISIL